MNSRKILLSLALPLAISWLYSESLAADRFGSAFRECSYYRTPQQFVREAIVFCIKQGAVTQCEREARKYYQQCGFKENFNVLSQAIYSRMLLQIVVAKAPELSNLKAR